jgi:hypothetical protein
LIEKDFAQHQLIIATIRNDLDIIDSEKITITEKLFKDTATKSILDAWPNESDL